MKWERIDGEAWSEDGRFHIVQETGRQYYGKWKLCDTKTQREYICETHKKCKEAADELIESESV